MIWDQHPILGFGTRTFNETFLLHDQLVDRGVGGWHNEYLQVYLESFVGNQVAVADIVAYLRDDRPLYLVPLRRWAPPGLPVYSTRLALRKELRAAGLGVRMVSPGVIQIDGERAE